MCRAASRRSLDAFSHAMNSGNLSVNRTLYESVQHNLPVFTQGQRIAWVMACQWMRFLIDWNERVGDVERSRQHIRAVLLARRLLVSCMRSSSHEESLERFARKPINVFVLVISDALLQGQSWNEWSTTVDVDHRLHLKKC